MLLRHTVLKDLRAARGMSLRELSEKAGVSYSYIKDLEHNRHTPSLRVAQRLARALGCHLDSLVWFDVDNERDEAYLSEEATP
jgi:transcriptional regulator with XRE-family HTH domain